MIKQLQIRAAVGAGPIPGGGLEGEGEPKIAVSYVYSLK
jgi:hypothetical protein